MQRTINIQRSSRRGMTLLEVTFASILGLSVTLFMMFIIIFTARSEAVLLPQMQRQQSAGQAMQRICNLLRNSSQASISISDGVDENSNQIFFTTGETPAGKSSAIKMSNGSIFYLSDSSDSSTGWPIGRNLESINFSLVSMNQIVEIEISYLYRKSRGYGSDDDTQLNGTFITRIFPRNK